MSILKKLHRAEISQQLVRVHRTGLRKEPDYLDGKLRAVGNKWAIIATYDDGVYFDGWNVLRIADISRVKPAGKSAQSYFARAAEGQPPTPIIPSELAAAIQKHAKDPLWEILASHPLVGIYIEREDPDMLFIGRFAGADKKDIGLQQVSPQGTWDQRRASSVVERLRESP